VHKIELALQRGGEPSAFLFSGPNEYLYGILLILFWRVGKDNMYIVVPNVPLFVLEARIELWQIGNQSCDMVHHLDVAVR